ncbi:MAG: hypothetical protein ACOH2E_06475 [Candidatus Paracaedibacter sp.]
MLPQGPFVVRVANGKIREIKKSLRQIFKTFNITDQDPIDFSTADKLLNSQKELGTKWEPVTEAVRKYLGNHLFTFELAEAINFVHKNEDKVEFITRRLAEMNFLTPDRKIFNLPSLLDFLAEEDLLQGLEILRHLHSSRLYQGNLVGPAISRILQMPEPMQLSTAEGIKQCAEDMQEPKNLEAFTRALLWSFDVDPDRITDLLGLMKPLSLLEQPWQIRDVVIWAFGLNPDQYQHVPLFISLGLDHNQAQYLPDIIAHESFIHDHLRGLRLLIKANADRTLSLLRDQKLTVSVLAALSRLDAEKKKRVLYGAELVNVISRITTTPIPFAQVINRVPAKLLNNHPSQNPIYCAEFYDALDKFSLNLSSYCEDRTLPSLEELEDFYSEFIRICAYATQQNAPKSNLLNLAIAVTKQDPSVLKSIGTSSEDWYCNCYLDGVSNQLGEGLPRTLPLIPFFAKYYGLHRVRGTFNLLMNLKDPSLALRLLGDFIDLNLRSDASSAMEERKTFLLNILEQIDKENDTQTKERQINLFQQCINPSAPSHPIEELLKKWKFSTVEHFIQLFYEGKITRKTEDDVQALKNTWYAERLLSGEAFGEPITLSFLEKLEKPQRLAQKDLFEVFTEFSKVAYVSDCTGTPVDMMDLSIELWRLYALYNLPPSNSFSTLQSYVSYNHRIAARNFADVLRENRIALDQKLKAEDTKHTNIKFFDEAIKSFLGKEYLEAEGKSRAA